MNLDAKLDEIETRIERLESGLKLRDGAPTTELVTAAVELLCVLDRMPTHLLPPGPPGQPYTDYFFARSKLTKAIARAKLETE